MNRLARVRNCYVREGLTAETVALFRSVVYDRYRRHPRPLPWRNVSDPYAILVSEVMLQQTRVERVLEKYHPFLDLFPDFVTLAAAPLSAVISAWQGLGYNRRAVALKRCAEAVTERFAGRLPEEPEILQTLPGIGPYTAGAIAAFAYDRPSPFIETNIRSLFIHTFFPDQNKVHDRELLPLVAAVMDHEHPRQWYYALMDLGATLKKTDGNPSRRSAHHTTQSPFEGSNRQLRSRILRTILASPGITLPAIALELRAEPAEVEANLNRLAREGFIRTTGDGYCVS